MPVDAGTEQENSEQAGNAILAEQLRLLFDATPVSFAATVINAGILYYVLAGIISSTVLTSWLVVICLVSLYRVALFIVYRKKSPPDSAVPLWNKLHLFGVVIAASCWGSTTLIMFAPDDVSYQTFLGFIMAGMSAGAVSTLSFQRAPALIFLSATLPLLVIRLFLEGTVLGNAMAVMVLLFLIIMISSVFKLYRSTYQNIVFRIESVARENKLRESEARLRMVFESAPLGLLHFNASGIILSCNANAAELFSKSQEQMLSVNLFELVKDDDFLDELRKSLQGQSGLFNGSTSVFDESGDVPVRVFFRGMLSLSGMVTGGVAILEDMTEDVRIERMKNEFVSTVSHELRTPLTAINGAIGMLLAEQGGLLGEDQQRELIQLAGRNTDRLLLLVNDILDIGKISSGRMGYKFENQKLMPVIERALQDNQTYGDKYQVRFELVKRADDVSVRVDSDRLLQVLANLLSNAAKFSPADASVDVAVESDGEFVRISVHDSGAGIPKAFHESLYSPFTQDDASDTRRAGGTGLGLYISREIIQAMAGKISFKTGDGAGTTFIIELPVAK